MRTHPSTSRASRWLALTAAGLAIFAPAAFGQTVSSQATVGVYNTAPNLVDKSATTAPNDLDTFKTDVAAAFAADVGGVFNFPSVTAGTTVCRGTFGSSGTKRVDLTFSRALQSVANNGSFTQTSDPIGIAQNADSDGYNITVGAVLDATTGEAIPSEGVTRIGFTVLSRTHASYPCDIRATAILSDGARLEQLATVGNPKGSDDTFFGFTATAGKVIQSIELRSLISGTVDPANTRIALDDIAFIVSSASPPPVIQALSPANFAIATAASGITFNVVASETAPVETITATLNGADVTGQLNISGPAHDRIVTLGGLGPNAEYVLEIAASNSSGSTTSATTFYTHEGPFTLYDSEGFASDELYPLGFLQAVTHGRATIVPHPSEPASVTAVEEPYGKVVEKINSGASRADWVHFPPVSSGVIVIELDAFVSTTSGRTIDLTLSPLTSADMASFVAWGGVADKLAWFDNASWLPIADLQAGWHRYKIVNYLSGPAAGYFDVLVDDVKVGDKLRWRNVPVGVPLGRLRFHSQDINPILEYGRIDNLTITATPEDPNAFPPPTIANFLPANNAVILPTAGFSFEATSAVPIAAADIHATLDGTDISGALTIGGTTTARVITYSPAIPAGRHTLEISVTTAAGTSTVSRAFIATVDPLVLFDSGGFEDPEIYPEGPLQAVTHGDSIWAPAAVDPAQIVPIDDPVNHVLRRVQVGVDRIDNLRFPSVAGGVLTIEFDARVSVIDTRTLDFCLIHATSGNMASFISWGTVADQFAYYNGSAWIGVASPGTDSHRYKLVNYLEGSNLAKYDLFVDGASVGEKLPFRHAFPAGTAVGVLRIGAIRGTAPGEFGEIDNLKISIAPYVAAPNQPEIQNLTRADNRLSFSFATQNGIAYVVEYKTSLDAAEWTTLESFTGDGNVRTVTDPTPIADNRFYRVRAQ